MAGRPPGAAGRGGHISGAEVPTGPRGAACPPRHAEPRPRSVPRAGWRPEHPCAVAAEYRLVAKKGEGTFSEVLKAQCIKNGKYVAIKCMKNHFDSLDQARHNGPHVDRPPRPLRALRRRALSPAPRAGEQPARDSGAAQTLAAPTHHPAAGSPLVRGPNCLY